MSFIPTPLAAIAGLVALLAIKQATGNAAAAGAVGIVVAVIVFAWAVQSDAVPSEHSGM